MIVEFGLIFSKTLCYFSALVNQSKKINMLKIIETINVFLLNLWHEFFEFSIFMIIFNIQPFHFSQTAISP